MAGLPNNSRIKVGVLCGSLAASWRSQTRKRAILNAKSGAGEWRVNGGLPYSSWEGGTRSRGFGYHSYQRSDLATIGDWACLGLTVLAGGLFWNSSRNSAEETSILERSGQLFLLYGALQYSLQRKTLRLRLKWLRLKLVFREVELRELEQENEASLVALEDIIEGLEDGLVDGLVDGAVGPIHGPSKPIHSMSDDPFLHSALALLWRIDKLRSSLQRSPQEQVDPFPPEVELLKPDWLEEQLSRIELLVKRLMGFHMLNEARITHNKELRAKVDALLVNLEKER
ncbi:uncharacterized protein LOC144703780 [Wolffia australiana]